MMDLETGDADLLDDEPLPRIGRTEPFSSLGLVLDGFFGLLEILCSLLEILFDLLGFFFHLH